MYSKQYAGLESMISHSKENAKYYTGKAIKEIVLNCLADETIKGQRREELLLFEIQYIRCQHPLSDSAEYAIKWNEERTILNCFTKK